MSGEMGVAPRPCAGGGVCASGIAGARVTVKTVCATIEPLAVAAMTGRS